MPASPGGSHRGLVDGMDDMRSLSSRESPSMRAAREAPPAMLPGPPSDATSEVTQRGACQPCTNASCREQVPMYDYCAGAVVVGVTCPHACVPADPCMGICAGVPHPQLAPIRLEVGRAAGLAPHPPAHTAPCADAPARFPTPAIPLLRPNASPTTPAIAPWGLCIHGSAGGRFLGVGGGWGMAIVASLPGQVARGRAAERLMRAARWPPACRTSCPAV